MTATEKKIIDFVCSAGSRYWENEIRPTDFWTKNCVPLSNLGRSWEYVSLTKEYYDLGVNGLILVDSACMVEGGDRSLPACDLYLAAFHTLQGLLKSGLRKTCAKLLLLFLGVPDECFDYAWVNRILLLLRRLGAKHLNVEENLLFGPIPKATIRLEHDVDALDKTLQIRFKQSLFELYCLLNKVIHLDWSGVKTSIKKCTG